MATKQIVFSLPTWLIVLLETLKSILIALSISTGIASALTQIQEISWISVFFLCAREGVSKILKIWVKQAIQISDDDDK